MSSRQMKEIEDSTLKSSQRSLDYLKSTEEVGAATAKELLDQRNQLEKTSNHLASINSNLECTQRNLNGIKSMFSGLKNYFTGNSDIESNTSFKVSSPPDEQYAGHPTSFQNDPQMQHQVQKGENFNNQLDQNLDEMSNCLSRLKDLAIGMNREIDFQDGLIDHILNECEGVDVKIDKQNSEMLKILKKK